MPELTTINITKDVRADLEEVKDFLRENRGVNPSANDALAHLLRFWEEKREDKGKEIRDPEQAQNPEDGE